MWFSTYESQHKILDLQLTENISTACTSSPSWVSGCRSYGNLVSLSSDLRSLNKDPSLERPRKNHVNNSYHASSTRPSILTIRLLASAPAETSKHKHKTPPHHTQGSLCHFLQPCKQQLLLVRQGETLSIISGPTVAATFFLLADNLFFKYFRISSPSWLSKCRRHASLTAPACTNLVSAPP